MVLESDLQDIPENAPLREGQPNAGGAASPPAGLSQLLTRRFPSLGGATGMLIVMKTTIALLTTIAGLALVAIAVPARAGAATREYEGTVVSVNRDAKTFRLRDSERGTIRIKVNRSTRYERLSGFGGLSAGLKNIEATVRRANGRWVALEVERSGGGGDHGDDGDDDD